MRADVPLQVEELRTNSMAHMAWVLPALVKVLSQLEELVLLPVLLVLLEMLY
jgi:hypothetical protein